MIVGSLFTRGAHHAETKITEIYFVKKGLQVKDALFYLILRKTGGAITKAIFGHYSGLYGVFFALYFLKVNLHHYSKIKSIKKSQKSENQGFSNYFCLMIEGSGSVPLTNGSGSGRPKNIRIQIRTTVQTKTIKMGL
jgi:hypothetical protein